MLGVVEHFRGILLEVFERIEDQLEILLQRDAQRFTDMEIPGFAEDGDGIRLGLDQGDDVIVFIRGDFCPAGGTEGSDLGLFELFFLDVLEKGDILGITARPTPFNIVDPQFIKLMGDTDLVLNQKRDILRLGSVAQGCIVQFDDAHLFLPNGRLRQPA